MSQALSSARVSQTYHDRASSSLKENATSTFQPKEYASFSSLLWKRIGLHRWWWKGYVVWGVGVSPTGVGGRWYGTHHGLSVAFLSQFDAQASVETYELQRERPAIDMN